MRKACLFAGIALMAGSLYSVIRAQTFHFTDRYAAREKEKKVLNTFLEAGQYDSVISRCAFDREHDSLGYNDIELALAHAYWYKNDKITAYQYVQKSADYQLSLSGGGGEPFEMLYDYTFGPALAEDSFLEHIIIGKVSDYYNAMKYYPDPSTGLKLMLMDYKSQKLIEKQRYDLQHAQTDANKKALITQYEQEKEIIDAWLIDLLKENQKIFTRNDIGPADEKQFELIKRFDKHEQFDQVQPLLYRAMVDKEMVPDRYVDALVAAEQLKGSSKKLRLFEDSLCRVYKCTRSVSDSMGNMFSYVTGDTIFRYGDPVYIQDAQGQRMKLNNQAIGPKSEKK